MDFDRVLTILREAVMDCESIVGRKIDLTTKEGREEFFQFVADRVSEQAAEDIAWHRDDARAEGYAEGQADGFSEGAADAREETVDRLTGHATDTEDGVLLWAPTAGDLDTLRPYVVDGEEIVTQGPVLLSARTRRVLSLRRES